VRDVRTIAADQLQGIAALSDELARSRTVTACPQEE
jgi:hypothetical protein